MPRSAAKLLEPFGSGVSLGLWITLARALEHAPPPPNADPTDRVAYSEAFFRDDAAFLAALRSRVPAALAVFFDRHGAHVERLLVRLLGFDVELADLVQEVFVQALKSIADFRGEMASLRPWLNRVTVYVARHAIRRRRSRRWLFTTDPAVLPEPADPGAEPEIVEALRRAYVVLEALPLDERTVFTLRVIEQMPLSDVADACDVSLATCKRRIASARARFERRAQRDPILARWLQQEGDR
jgi:RNA polymerase sigma-70 factor (ECF subfamily)